MCLTYDVVDAIEEHGGLTLDQLKVLLPGPTHRQIQNALTCARVGGLIDRVEKEKHSAQSVYVTAKPRAKPRVGPMPVSFVFDLARNWGEI